MRILFVMLTGGFLCAGADFNDPIAADSHVTYADLLRLACSGLKINADDPARATVSDCEGGLWTGAEIRGLSLIASETLGPRRGLLVFEADHIMGVALFNLEAKPRLVGKIDVEGYGGQPSLSDVLSLSGGAVALVFQTLHVTTSLAAELTIVVGLRDDKLQMIGSRAAELSDGAEESVEVLNPGGVLQIRVTTKRKGRAARISTTTYVWDPVAKRYHERPKATAPPSPKH